MKSKIILPILLFSLLAVSGCNKKKDAGKDSSSGETEPTISENSDQGESESTPAGESEEYEESIPQGGEDISSAEYGVIINGISYVIPKDETAGEMEHREAAYALHGLNVKEGQRFSFYALGEEITSHLSAAGDDVAGSKYNNYVGSLDLGFKVQNDANNVSLYLNKWEAAPDNDNLGWVTFFLEGGANENHNEGAGPVVGQTTYTVTNLPGWIQDDGCIIFAWAWGGECGDGEWLSLTFNGNEASFEAESEINGFLLARCIAGTTEPNWGEKGNNPGRIYNQTNDITCQSGVYSYECSSWKEYNP